METQLANATVLIDEMWNQNSKFRRDKSIKLLTKIYTNIKNHPNDAKFRKLNISKIMSKPNIVSQLRELLLISGFKPNKNGTHIDLDDSNLNLCISVSNILENRMIEEENKLEEEREKIKQKTKEKQAKYIEKSNARKNELMRKIKNEKKDISKEKELGFKIIQKKNTNIINSNSNPNSIIKTKVKPHSSLKTFDNDSPNEKRTTWIIGSKCEIYLPLSNEWINGRISNINENNNDILTIKYMGFKTKQYNVNSEYIRAIMKTKSKFIKDPEIMNGWYNIIIEYWWKLCNIYGGKDMNINRMIILFSLNAYRLILTKDTEYYNNKNRQRQVKYNATNNRNISIKLQRQKQFENYEREEFYNNLTNAIYKTRKEYNETRLPMPVSGINFKKEYVILINNKCYESELNNDYEINNNGKCIVFTVYSDMRNYNIMHNNNNNIWCVAIPVLFKFEKIGIKNIIKRIKKQSINGTSDNSDDNIDNYMNGNNENDNDKDVLTEIVEKIMFIDVKSGKIIQSKQEDKGKNENQRDFQFTKK